MKTLNEICKLAPSCKHAGDSTFCTAFCSPYLLLHGTDYVKGLGGLWKASNVPLKYRDSFVDNLPIESENPIVFKWAKSYAANILDNVANGTGIFLYSIPNSTNRLGTGTGKTTTAIALLHEYLLERVREQSRGGRVIETNPALFYKASELQTLYNSQFRGTPDMQEKASLRYYKIKDLLMKAEFLVLDDVGIRQKITDAFENELTEIIDARDSKVLATIYTSNLPLEKLADTMGDRIASRIEGMTVQLAMKGQDYRRGGVLK